MDVVRLIEMAQKEATGSPRYVEFQRSAGMSSGLYLLPRGATDPQGPHTEDECYLVLRGRARVDVDGRVSPVTAGDHVFVPARSPHRFLDIEEDLALLVVFAPAEGSQRAG